MAIVILMSMTILFGGCVDRAKRADEAQVHFRIAQQLIVKNETTQSLAAALKAQELDPQNAEIQNFVGLLYAQRADSQKAEDCFKKAIKANPKYSEAHNNLCVLLIEKGRYDDAIGSCQKAVENVTYATPERAYHNMGVAYERQGEVKKAIEAYKKGLLHNKNFVKSLRNLSNIYLNKKSDKEAYPLLEQASTACNASPKGAWGDDCPEVHYRLAMLFLKMKKRDRMVVELKDCIKADEEKGNYGKKCRTTLRVYK